MFGIGLPELILILAIALIVVGPEKLPELAKSIAKGILELKKTAISLKDSLQDEKDDNDWQRDLPYTLTEDMTSPPPEVIAKDPEKAPAKPEKENQQQDNPADPYNDDEHK